MRSGREEVMRMFGVWVACGLVGWLVVGLLVVLVLFAWKVLAAIAFVLFLVWLVRVVAERPGPG